MDVLFITREIQSGLDYVNSNDPWMQLIALICGEKSENYMSIKMCICIEDQIIDTNMEMIIHHFGHLVTKILVSILKILANKNRMHIADHIPIAVVYGMVSQ